MLSLRRIENIYKIEYTLENVTGARIGAGGFNIDPTLPDNSVMRDISGKPFIPGSTLKGLFRSVFESLFFDEINECCYHTKKATKTNRERFTEELKKGSLRICRVCRLFGSNFIAGRVLFSDSYCKNKAVVRVRDGVAIRRDVETIEDPSKFDFEVIEPGAEFSGEIVLQNIEEDDLKAMKEVFNLIDAGVLKIGGMKSRGLGRFAVKNLNVERVFPPEVK